jgi:Mlc titration factor MtfA (ptsG expression regulator)
MIVFLQIFFSLLVIILIILFVFQPRRKEGYALPENYSDILEDYVHFYMDLDEYARKRFDDKLVRFLSSVKITGANAEIEDLDRLLIGAAAVIPTFYIPDWEYINLKEVLVYPGNFNMDFEQHGRERYISGMVGTGHMQNVMILSKWEIRQGFIDGGSHHNTAIHEFIHLIDKMDGTLDGVPELLLERKFVPRWKELIELTMDQIRNGQSDINPYGATSPVECFAVISEYFFEQPEAFRSAHPELSDMLRRIFIRK